MLLLSFTVRNHKSLRDEVTLDLARPSLKTLVPAAGATWEQSAYPLIGLFGANASGKSTLLDAFRYAFSAINYSSTKWQAERRIPFVPFRLDGGSRGEPSLYELEFVSSGRRYLYGFEIDGSGIVREWLKDVPTSRWRTLIDRDRQEGCLKVHSSIRAVGPLSDRELVLSRAQAVNHEQLGPLAADLVDSFDFASVKDAQREQRLRALADALLEGQISFDEVVRLLQVADIGVEKVSVEEKSLPSALVQTLMRVQQAITTGGQDHQEYLELEEPTEEELAAVARRLQFQHRGEGDDAQLFNVSDESDGTIAWLALMIPALEALRNGGLYCVDEIDSSIHPHLLDVVLNLFADPELNPRCAQLVFTSHDTYVLSPLSEASLEPEQVWVTEKSYRGVTRLSSLADFPRHSDANVAKRYLLGRYGGTPRLAEAALAALVAGRGRSE